MPKVDRLTRVNELLKRELALLLETMHHRSASMLASVTQVNASVDLRQATVYVSVFGGTPAERRALFAELEAERVEFQHRLAVSLGFKHTPVLTFREDRRQEQGDRVLAILAESERRDAERGEAE
ncbi:MAG: ribosome-binding factor A [Lentisphaeria bacterium]|nr:ribosome-binding factor A [Lentisphaeria bacterium]